MISQSLFDETLLENQEAFDLSDEDALQETMDQFLSQLGVSNKDEPSTASAAAFSDGGPLAHLVLLHPSSTEGISLRQSRNVFRNCLEVLDSCVETDGSVTIVDYQEALNALKEVTSRLKRGNEGDGNKALPYLCIFRNSSSIYTLMSFLGVVESVVSVSESDGDDNKMIETSEVLLQTIKALLALLVKDECTSGNAIRVEMKDLFVSAMKRLVSISQVYLKLLLHHAEQNEATGEQNSTTTNLIETILLHSLQLATVATKNCESAKVGYVQGGGVKVLSSHLKLDNIGKIGKSRTFFEATCHLLASLCRYDDFRQNAGPLGATTSCAHDHALEFHRAGVEGPLVKIARDVLGELDGECIEGAEERFYGADGLAVAVLTALRVLSVNDDIIQCMVALGVLPVVTKGLQLSCKEEKSTARMSHLASASLGLLRNLCGNDEIKTNLCLGSCDQTSVFSTPSALPHVIHAMQLYPTVATLQEHACGTLAAMALRKPANAQAIIDQGGPRYILSAMKRHDRNPSVQRQGALAVRNLVSRLLRECPEDGEKGKEERNAIRDLFLELGAEHVLRTVTGMYQGSVDEAYAALRDLGCKVSLIKFNGDEQEQGTMMFGEKHNSNFRPVYEDSEELEKGVAEAVSRFGL